MKLIILGFLLTVVPVFNTAFASDDGFIKKQCYKIISKDLLDKLSEDPEELSSNEAINFNAVSIVNENYIRVFGALSFSNTFSLSYEGYESSLKKSIKNYFNDEGRQALINHLTRTKFIDTLTKHKQTITAAPIASGDVRLVSESSTNKVWAYKNYFINTVSSGKHKQSVRIIVNLKIISSVDSDGNILVKTTDIDIQSG